MIDIGLTNALAQITDALYDISDNLKENTSEKVCGKCRYCIDDSISLECSLNIGLGYVTENTYCSYFVRRQ